MIVANPEDELTPVEDQNYWIRAVPAAGCFPSLDYGNETVGVIRYSRKNTKTPTTSRYPFDTICRDEPYPSLVPIVAKNVGQAKNDCKPFCRQALQSFSDKPYQSRVLTTTSLDFGKAT